MEWDSPWGVGFPGWHIECSAMSMKYLGKTFDIHCGGVDHIPIHHTNEIAQSEACTGQKFVNYWLHGEFLIEEKGKMSKSAGEFLRLETLVNKGYSPLDYRYFLLLTHYRKKIKFSFENLDAARNGFNNLKSKIAEIYEEANSTPISGLAQSKHQEYKMKFTNAVNDDLNVSEGLAILWNVLKDDDLEPGEKLNLAYDFDSVFGLNLKEVRPQKEGIIPEEVLSLAEERKQAKINKNFADADSLREKIKSLGFEVLDKKQGDYELKKI
jgi:cysteinyl-tRNA synthetase